ncbi:MAG TPA: Wall-associated protein precursor [Archangium sp.]|uniref:Wall-associated protein precursor n=1 Tax=Archangium sp. TaxID=1872627 RepID=UPI002E32B486|nr:Wall-associated protein precursor [Archangium sp.]HEX5752911.1 Wall-associated protein precursor [Archangium sp.]
MLSVLLLIVATQLPCVAGDSTAICDCKQGRPTGCAALDTRTATELAQALRALKVAEEEQQAKAAGASAEAASEAPEPPACTGQLHHIISKPIFRELDKHPTLMGVYGPRDSRFVTRAVDEKAHCGYQEWHRKVDEEVVEWLKQFKYATAEQFEAYLRSIYNRPDMLKRFPLGF